MPTETRPTVLVLSGVSGSGKTYVGERLAKALGWRFLEGDEFHPPENIKRMSAGQPLTDEDREPWLRAIRAEIESSIDENRSAVITCSALKQKYRDLLTSGLERRVKLIQLQADPRTLRERLRKRKDHFFKEGLLDSQLATVEPPRSALIIDTTEPAEKIIARIREEFRI